MILAGAGVDHDELVRLGEKLFSGLPEGQGARGSSAAANAEPSEYSGGEARNVMSADKARQRRYVGCLFGWWVGCCLGQSFNYSVRHLFRTATQSSGPITQTNPAQLVANKEMA